MQLCMSVISMQDRVYEEKCIGEAATNLISRPPSGNPVAGSASAMPMGMTLPSPGSVAPPLPAKMNRRGCDMGGGGGGGMPRMS